MKALTFLVIPFLFLAIAPSSIAQTGTPVNDDCLGAIEVEVGQRISGSSNSDATLSSNRPSGYPATCIQTFENDLWYRFTTKEEYNFYKVYLTYSDCNTPAGMQGILIENIDCAAGEYKYRGCANYRSMDTIKMILSEPIAGKEILIYIDGFDGTICTFDLWIEASDSSDIEKRDYRRNKYDYDPQTLPVFEPIDYEAGFDNNSFSISWSVEGDEDVDYFLVEHMRSMERNGPHYSQVVAVIDPKANVAGGTTYYDYTDYEAAYKNGVTYCYRIVKVNTKGEKFFGEGLCREAEVAESFFVTEILYSKVLADTWIIHYLNYKKNQNFTVELLNEAKEVLKSVELKKEPVRDGNINLDMKDYPAGRYFVKMGNGKEYFMRSFEKAASAGSSPPDKGQ